MIDLELTIQQVSKLLECSESTVRRMEESGELKVLKSTEGGHRRFNFLDVLQKVKQFPAGIKLSLDGVNIKKLKEELNKFSDDETSVNIVIEDHSSFRSIGIYGKKYGTHMMI